VNNQAENESLNLNDLNRVRPVCARLLVPIRTGLFANDALMPSMQRTNEKGARLN